MASTITSTPKSYSLLTHYSIKSQTPINSLFSPVFYKPNKNPNLTQPRLRSCHHSPAWRRKRVNVVLAVSESAPESESSDSNGDATIDLKLPRRRLLVQFTCDDCGERTQRLINRLAYERGLVYVQCAGCLRHHKLVDNLGLVIEYDLRKDISIEPNTDQV